MACGKLVVVWSDVCDEGGTDTQTLRHTDIHRHTALTSVYQDVGAVEVAVNHTESEVVGCV